MSSQSNLTDDPNQFRQARRRRQRERALDVDTTPYGPSERDDAGDGATEIVPECQHCGEHVMPRTVRIFGSNSGRLHACFDCTSFRELQEGAGATPDYTPERRGLGTADEVGE